MNFDKVKEKAQEEWTDKLLLSFENAGTAKKRWEVYRKLTDKKTDNSVLPLLDINGSPVFEKKEKCKLFEQVFL